MSDGTTGDLYRLFADLLEYPTPALDRQAQECTGRVRPAAAAALLDEFCRAVEQVPLTRMEELYTSTFDLQAVCTPYVGYHLFGESYKRGLFMAQLNAGYRERGFSTGRELPDHLPVVLRFLASAPADDFSLALLDEGLIPALGGMAQALGDTSDNPYAVVIHALLLVLRDPGGPGLREKE